MVPVRQCWFAQRCQWGCARMKTRVCETVLTWGQASARQFSKSVGGTPLQWLPVSGPSLLSGGSRSWWFGHTWVETFSTEQFVIFLIFNSTACSQIQQLHAVRIQSAHKQIEQLFVATNDKCVARMHINKYMWFNDYLNHPFQSFSTMINYNQLIVIHFFSWTIFRCYLIIWWHHWFSFWNPQCHCRIAGRCPGIINCWQTSALCYSSKRLVLTWVLSHMNYEFEYQSSASFPMICTVLL